MTIAARRRRRTVPHPGGTGLGIGRGIADRGIADRLNSRPDTGSVTPLVIGMMLCLLLLGAGVTAAGSAFLAGQRTQHLCDGAVATAAGTVSGVSGGSNTDDSAANAVANYLAVRASSVSTSLTVGGDTLTLTCSSDSPITFGALFGAATLHRTTTATARTHYRQN